MRTTTLHTPTTRSERYLIRGPANLFYNCQNRGFIWYKLHDPIVIRQRITQNINIKFWIPMPAAKIIAGRS